MRTRNRIPMKTRLFLAALATTASVFAAPVNAPEISSTLPLLAVGVVALGLVARRLRK
jgi:flagellar biosynthesis protein FliR